MEKTDPQKKNEEEEEREESYDPLKLCSQEPYPGDQGLRDCEREFLGYYGLNQPPPVELEATPNPQLAFEECEKARRLFEAGNYEEALVHCTCSIRNAVENAASWKLRCETYLALDKPREAFRDLLVARKDNNTPEIWTLGGKILKALDMPVLAETWLRKATQVSDGKHREAALLFQQIRTKRLYEPLTTGLPIEVKFEEYGRGIFAKEDFNGGQMVWREVPIISAQTSISLKAPACSQCARSLLTAIDYFGDDVLRSMKPAERRVVAKYWPQVSIIECPKCQREKYCREDCLKAAWYQHHQVLCSKKNKAAAELYDFCDKGELCTEGYWSAPFSPMSVARIWAAVIADVRRAVKQAREDGADTDEPTVEMWAHAKAPYRRFIAYGKAGHAEWAHKMVDLMNRVFNNFPDGINYKIDNREFEGRYYQVACNCQSFSDPQTPYRRFLSRMKVDSNSKHVVPYMASIGEPKEAVFGGLFALHACLNHSCDNDVEILDCDVGGFPGIGVRARRKIAAGQELFSTYIDTRTARAERRAWLFRAYNFWCQCRRCQFEGDGPEECSHCGVKPEQGKYFLGCANCKRAWYCTPKCQKIAWKKGHKRICKTKHSDVVSSVEEPVREQIRKLADLFYKEMPKNLSKPSESK